MDEILPPRDRLHSGKWRRLLRQDGHRFRRKPAASLAAVINFRQTLNLETKPRIKNQENGQQLNQEKCRKKSKFKMLKEKIFYQ